VSDLEAGTNAGARAVIGVLTGAHDRATLSTAPHTDLLEDHSGFLGSVVGRGRFPDRLDSTCEKSGPGQVRRTASA
jgi:hypothetical protein